MKGLNFNHNDEYHIIQNSVLGAHCIHSALIYFEEKRKESKKRIGMSLPICYLILPIVYNNEFSKVASNMRFKINSFRSSFYDSGLTYHNVLNHATNLFPTTSQSLNIGFGSGLIDMDKDTAKLLTLKATELPSKSTKDYDYGAIVQASRRVGAWFGQMDDSDILSLFTN